MTDDATNTKAGGSPLLSEELGPLPEPALTVVKNWATLETQVSDHGTAYYGSNWYAHQRCYSEDQMRAYAARERSTERAALAALCDRAVQDFAPDGLGGDFGHGFRSACELLKQAIERGPNAELRGRPLADGPA